MSQPVFHLRAIFYALAGFTCWVMSDTFVKLAAETGAPKYEIMALAGPSGMAMIFIVTFLRNKTKKLRPARPGKLATLAILGLGSYVCLLIALPRLPLANFYAVIFIIPILVAVMATLFLHEKSTWQKNLAIACGFAGVLIAVGPVAISNEGGGWMGYGAACIAAFGIALQLLLLRVLRTQETRECIAFYPRFGALFGGLVGIAIWGFSPIPAQALVCSLASGCVGSLGWLLMAHAYKLAPAATVAPFQYSEIVTGAAIGYVIWHDVPTLHLLVGAVIIIGCGFYIITHSRKSAALLKEESHS